MVQVITNLDNFDKMSSILEILQKFSNDFILENGVYYAQNCPNCPECGQIMTRNGSNKRTKKGIITLKIGKYHCPNCHKNTQESPELFEKLVQYVREKILPLLVTIRSEKVSYRGIEEIMGFLIPLGKDSAYGLIQGFIESAEFPELEAKDIQVLGYDEQIVFVGGKKKNRILIFDILSGTPIFEVLEDSKTSEIIKSAFKSSSIDFSKTTIIVTDLDKSYPKILDELFGENLYHQPCLFHLLQLICKTFSKNCSMYEEFLKFTLLNVFYDHSVQLEWLIEKVNEEKEILASKSKNEYKLWLKSAKKDFVQLTKQIEKKQRIDGIDTMIRNFDEILSQFVDVLENIEMYPPLLQKRIKMIDDNFVKLTTFCESDIIPPTNNATENYFLEL